jgi:hypothetical protein
MAIKIGLILGAVAAILSGVAALYFLGCILLWTFDLATEPVQNLVRLAIWCVCFALCWLLLSYLSTKELATGRARP